METLFLICAVVGGTVFLTQFVMALVGLGGDSLEFVDDIPDEMAGDIGDAQGSVLDHGSTWLFGVISFRTVVAAMTFFGFAGMACTTAQLTAPTTVLISLMAGVSAMFIVHWLMQLLYRLGHDGTVNIQRAVGLRGIVYLPIPAENEGAGKIQLKLQNRIVEYQAMTSGPDKLPAGARIEVTDIISPSTVEVQSVTQTAKCGET